MFGWDIIIKRGLPWVGCTAGLGRATLGKGLGPYSILAHVYTRQADNRILTVAASQLRLMARNGWRVAHVVATRQLGIAPRYLPVVLMFITDQCNLRCSMCGVCELEHARSAGKELSTGEWFSVIDAAQRLGTMLVSISGGEPLLRADLCDLVRHARSRDMGVHLCTNGTLMTTELARRLHDSGVSVVSVSLDSPHAAAHERLRGKDTFAPAVEAIRLLREFAPDTRVGINCLITRQNCKTMAEMVEFAESLGVHQIKFAPVHTNLLHRLKHIEEYGDLLFAPGDLSELEAQVKLLGRACAKSRLLTTSPAFFEGIVDLYGTPRSFRCHAGWAAVAVGPTGSVAPCADMDGVLSVRQLPLDEIWRSREFHQQRKCVQNCKSACWDTTNTELSLRLRPSALMGEFLQNWRDVNFYFGGKK